MIASVSFFWFGITFGCDITEESCVGKQCDEDKKMKRFSPEGLRAHRKDSLKKICTSVGLVSDGNRKVLVSRILDAQTKNVFNDGTVPLQKEGCCTILEDVRVPPEIIRLIMSFLDYTGVYVLTMMSPEFYRVGKPVLDNLARVLLGHTGDALAYSFFQNTLLYVPNRDIYKTNLIPFRSSRSLWDPYKLTKYIMTQFGSIREYEIQMRTYSRRTLVTPEAFLRKRFAIKRIRSKGKGLVFEDLIHDKSFAEYIRTGTRQAGVFPNWNSIVDHAYSRRFRVYYPVAMKRLVDSISDFRLLYGDMEIRSFMELKIPLNPTDCDCDIAIEKLKARERGLERFDNDCLDINIFCSSKTRPGSLS